MINILVVEDSPVAREYLVHILNSDPGIKVIGTAVDGKEAVEAAGRLSPDVITMDINMPVIDGLEATRRIMETHPVPIVIVSGIWDPKEVETTFRAIEAGALAIVQRPVGIGHAESDIMTKELLQTIKLMSEIKVVRRWASTRRKQEVKSIGTADVLPLKPQWDIRVIAIGASAGGPLAIQKILSALPADFPIPVLIVQHIASGFIQGMVDWLSNSTDLCLQIAGNGDYIRPGHVYFAPDGFHLEVTADNKIALSNAPPDNGLRPSVAALFRSVSEAFNNKAIGVLLTGMGRDGAQELKLLREKGAITFAQNEESSIVYGMPGEAIKIGAAVYEFSPEKMASALINLAVHGERKKQ